MNYSEALHLVKHGHKMRRRIWPEHVYIYRYDPPFPDGEPVIVAHHAHLEDPDWRPSSRDQFATDWEQAGD